MSKWRLARSAILIWMIPVLGLIFGSGPICAQEIEPFGTANIPFNCSSIKLIEDSVKIEFPIFEKRRKAYRVGDSGVFFAWQQSKTLSTLNLSLSKVHVTNLEGDQELTIGDAVVAIGAGNPVLLLCSHEKILPLFKNTIKEDAIVIWYRPTFLR